MGTASVAQLRFQEMTTTLAAKLPYARTELLSLNFNFLAQRMAEISLGQTNTNGVKTEEPLPSALGDDVMHPLDMEFGRSGVQKALILFTVKAIHLCLFILNNNSFTTNSLPQC